MKRALAKYREKRDFDRTSEPSGQHEVRPGDRFVIQQHAARRMHYDFRLELDGVLLSWSVPKGPSLSPKDKRLAVRTEDHPLDYVDFEGIIPKGQYGGGTVSVWDRGSWQPEGDARAGLERGRLTFTLAGHKLHGKWHLVRTKPTGKQDSWLLFKGRDDAANDEVDIVSAEPNSVLSARSLDQIAEDPEHVWSSNRPADVAALVSQLPVGFPLTNLDKVLYPEQNLTKGQLVAYLAVVAEHMLPHVAGRPLTLVRCPEGRKGQCFYQKKRAAGTPAAVGTVRVAESNGEPADYMQIHDLAGLIALAQLGTLEIHTWGCHADKLERPDLIVFDLDPDPAVAWDRVAAAALQLRRRLGDAGLDSWVKTTGGKGLHVVAPLAPRATWDELVAFAKQLVDRLAADEPADYTTNMRKAERKGRIYLDYLRNSRGATFIAPYSPRARQDAPVAVPITWEELAHGIDPSAFTVATVPRRLGELARDPWAGLADADQRLPRPHAARRKRG
ncbi:MAG TPA: non-homologous end-joining DNA ligase [Kofleriaceae bacterium]|jgi:bifunctional non-homologous end joining protein LigD